MGKLQRVGQGAFILLVTPKPWHTREGTDREPSWFAAQLSPSKALIRFGRPSAYLAAANRDGSRSGGAGEIAAAQGDLRWIQRGRTAVIALKR
jgi:hypothetical protein